MWNILFVKKEGMLMKATGIVRKVDNLGRIVIPKETRKTLQVETSDALEFFVEEDAIVLQNIHLMVLVLSQEKYLQGM